MQGADFRFRCIQVDLREGNPVGQALRETLRYRPLDDTETSTRLESLLYPLKQLRSMAGLARLLRRILEHFVQPPGFVPNRLEIAVAFHHFHGAADRKSTRWKSSH